MTETTFKRLLSQFLNDYWGAFHEVLEAQSVTPMRVAGSLYNALLAQHKAFEGVYAGPGKIALDGLGHIWHDLEIRRLEWPDPALTHDEVTKAVKLFQEIYDALLRQGHDFRAAREEILKQAPHGTPEEPLRVDAAR